MSEASSCVRTEGMQVGYVSSCVHTGLVIWQLSYLGHVLYAPGMWPGSRLFCTVPLADSAWGLWCYLRFDGLMCFSPCGLMDFYYWTIAVVFHSTAELKPC